MLARTRLIPWLAGSALVALIACSDPSGPDVGTSPTFASPGGGVAGLAVAGEPGARAWLIRAGVTTAPADAPQGCVAYLTSVIEGFATHLGRFDGVGGTCITDQVAPDPDPPFFPAGPPPYARATFHNPLWTLTAADGDELWLEGFASTAVLSLVDNSLIGRGHMRVVGGTGRFEGATGMAVVGAVNDDGIGPDDFRGEGWIRF